MVLLPFEWINRDRVHAFDVAHWRKPVRWVFYYAMIAVIIAFANFHYVPFIYFDF